jgi:hypothetical protein
VEPGLPIPVVITAFADKSFTFIMKTPPATILIKKAAGIQKGSAEAPYRQGRQDHPAQCEEIAKAKMPDLTAADIDAAVVPSPAPPAAWASPWRACNHGESLSKRVQALRAKVDRNKAYPLTEALTLVKECATAKFDESIDVAVNLGVRCQEVRPAGSRFRGAAGRYRQDRSRCRVRPGRKG